MTDAPLGGHPVTWPRDGSRVAKKRGFGFPAFLISRSSAVGPLREEGRYLLAGDHLLKGLAGVDQLESATFHQHLGGHPAGVVAARHGVAVGAGAEEADQLALAHLEVHALDGADAAVVHFELPDLKQRSGHRGRPL